MSKHDDHKSTEDSANARLIAAAPEMTPEMAQALRATLDWFVPALRAQGLDVVLQVTGRGQFDVRYIILDACRGGPVNLPKNDQLPE